jgi:hypothetical protein
VQLGGSTTTKRAATIEGEAHPRFYAAGSIGGRMIDGDEQTRIMTVAGRLSLTSDERVHFLELVHGLDGRRYVVDAVGATLGRRAPADIVLADSEISRAHCRLAVRDGELWVRDLGSTNGTFVNGERLGGAVVLPVGGILQVGAQLLKHECRSRREYVESDALDRDLSTASAYVDALLPPKILEGPIRADWWFKPSTKLGGDAFGYAPLPDGRFAAYLMDVSGHGAAAAMHSVAVMNVLRQRALPDTDMAQPAAVLRALNEMFQMERHAEMYFTLWYGVFDPESRRLDYACAGHHAAYMAPADRSGIIPLRTRNPMIGAVSGRSFLSDSVEVPAGASLYVFSDGVFEIVTKDDQQWGLQDFLPLLLQPSAKGVSEGERLFDEVVRVARPGGLDDDFSLVVLTFD